MGPFPPCGDVGPLIGFMYKYTKRERELIQSLRIQALRGGQYNKRKSTEKVSGLRYVANGNVMDPSPKEKIPRNATPTILTIIHPSLDQRI